MTILIWICLGLFFLLFALKLAYVASVSTSISQTGGALYVSTTRKRIRDAAGAIPLMGATKIVDLGCGDGRILRTVCKLTDATCIGFEINLLAWAKAVLLCLPYKNIPLAPASSLK